MVSDHSRAHSCPVRKMPSTEGNKGASVEGYNTDQSISNFVSRREGRFPAETYAAARPATRKLGGAPPRRDVYAAPARRCGAALRRGAAARRCGARRDFQPARMAWPLGPGCGTPTRPVPLPGKPTLPYPTLQYVSYAWEGDIIS